MAITRSNKDYLGVLSVSAPDNVMLENALKEASTALIWDIGSSEK